MGVDTTLRILNKKVNKFSFGRRNLAMVFNLKHR